jgi:predicted enzyme related to lactoylglutathione lyase
MVKYSITFMVLLSLSACSFFDSAPSRPDNPIVRGVNFIGISVSDIEQSSELLSNSFAVNTVQDNIIANDTSLNTLLGRTDTKVVTRLVRSSNAQLRLMQFSQQSDIAKNMPDVNVHGPGIAHVCAQVNMETDAYGKFLAGGATTVGAPEMIQLSSKNPVYYAYARDHDKTMFEVEHVDITQLDLDAPPNNDYRIRHVALSSPDIDRLVEFYSVLLEQKNPRRFGNWFLLSGEKIEKMSGLSDAKLKMAFFQVRNMELEIAQYVSHPTEIPAEPRPIDALGHNMIMFDVADMAAARDKLMVAGGKVVIEPTMMDGGQTMFGRDPDGNLLGFQTLDASSPLSAQNFEGNGT